MTRHGPAHHGTAQQIAAQHVIAHNSIQQHCTSEGDRAPKGMRFSAIGLRNQRGKNVWRGSSRSKVRWILVMQIQRRISRNLNLLIDPSGPWTVRCLLLSKRTIRRTSSYSDTIRMLPSSRAMWLCAEVVRYRAESPSSDIACADEGHDD